MFDEFETGDVVRQGPEFSPSELAEKDITDMFDTLMVNLYMKETDYPEFSDIDKQLMAYLNGDFKTSVADIYFGDSQFLLTLYQAIATPGLNQSYGDEALRLDVCSVAFLGYVISTGMEIPEYGGIVEEDFESSIKAVEDSAPDVGAVVREIATKVREPGQPR